MQRNCREEPESAMRKQIAHRQPQGNRGRNKIGGRNRRHRLQKLGHHGRLRHLTGPDHANNPVPFKKNVHLGQLLVSLDHGRDKTLKIRLPTPSFQAFSSSRQAG
jgi:hypothetical protein